ncbi:hypothetical protein VP01_3573g2 [Puccinia sorghi]|uniref:Uncharacterized protein n=1 Tax=Puccinia sorghi TaxID=27349 RepID=A0A0L6UW40_9BASI|nr:hypothetical protein VP01_3573g2 [Puccinia sorghi]
MLLSTMINVVCFPCNTTKSHPCPLPMNWLPFVVILLGWHRGILTTVRDICRDAQNSSSMSLSFEYIYQPHKLALLSESHVICHLALKANWQPWPNVYSLDVLVILLFFLWLSNLILPTCHTQLKVNFQPLWEELLQALNNLNLKHHVNFWDVSLGFLRDLLYSLITRVIIAVVHFSCLFNFKNQLLLLLSIFYCKIVWLRKVTANWEWRLFSPTLKPTIKILNKGICWVDWPEVGYAIGCGCFLLSPTQRLFIIPMICGPCLMIYLLNRTQIYVAFLWNACSCGKTAAFCGT